MENKQQSVIQGSSVFNTLMEVVKKQKLAFEQNQKNTVLTELKITIYCDGTVKLEEDFNPASRYLKKIPYSRKTRDKSQSKQTENSFIQPERMRYLLKHLVGNGISNKLLKNTLGITYDLYRRIRYKGEPIEQELCKKIKSLNLFDLFKTQLDKTIKLKSGLLTKNCIEYIIKTLNVMSLQEKIKYIVSKQNTSRDKALEFIANEIGKSKSFVYSYFYTDKKQFIRDDKQTMTKLNNLVIEYLIKEQVLPYQKKSLEFCAKKKSGSLKNIDKQP